ncbi:MAG: hypothetical protein ACK53Y_07945, partial [bacterium]
MVIFGSFSACIRPHQTNTIILEEKMKTTLPVPEFIDQVLGMKMIVFVTIRPKRSYSIQSVPRDAVSACFGLVGSFRILELRRG